MAGKATEKKKQLLHLVLGGEVTDLKRIEFADLSKTHIVGLFPDYASAYNAWLSAARATIDHAQTRYFIVHLHRLLEPEKPKPARTKAKRTPAKKRA